MLGVDQVGDDKIKGPPIGAFEGREQFAQFPGLLRIRPAATRPLGRST
jgi:hypothetical protein